MKLIIPVAQLCMIGVITFFLFFCFTWIVIYYQTPTTSFKDAMGLSLTFLGSVTTVLTAIFAAYLFTDWRKVKQYEIILDYIMVIKKNVQDILTYINNNRVTILNFKNQLIRQSLTYEEFQSLSNRIFEFEINIVQKLNQLALEINELHYLKTKQPEHPACQELIKLIKGLDNYGLTPTNFNQVWSERLETDVLNIYFEYITNDLTSFVYDKIMVSFLDDLDLNNYKNK